MAKEKQTPRTRKRKPPGKTKAQAASEASVILRENPTIANRVEELVDEKMEALTKKLGDPLDWSEADKMESVRNKQIKSWASLIDAAALGSQFIPKNAVDKHLQAVQEKLQLDIGSVIDVMADVSKLTQPQRRQLGKGLRAWIKAVQDRFGERIKI